MRFCYAHRRFTLYPQSVDTWDLHPDNYTPEFLDRARDTGFDALECGFEVLAKLGDEKSISDFGERVRSHGLKVGAIRAGGTLTEAKHGPANREKLMRAVEYADHVGAEVVNGALSAPARYPGHPPGSIPGSVSGWPVSQDSSKDAQMWVYDELASVFQGVCDSNEEIDVTIEVHQNSPVDNSWSAVRIHDMIDRENFGINPDMGNVVWNYDVPEEDYDAAIDAMAPISKYWHCKNLHRVYHRRISGQCLSAFLCKTARLTIDMRYRRWPTRATAATWRSRAHRMVTSGIRTELRWSMQGEYGLSSRTDSSSRPLRA